MKNYLLDTSLVAGYLLNRVRAIDLVSPLIKREEAATSILVYGEVVEYVKGFPDFPTHRDKLQALCGLPVILSARCALWFKRSVDNLW